MKEKKLINNIKFYTAKGNNLIELRGKKDKKIKYYQVWTLHRSIKFIQWETKSIGIDLSS